jgi:hypothetical protein
MKGTLFIDNHIFEICHYEIKDLYERRIIHSPGWILGLSILGLSDTEFIQEITEGCKVFAKVHVPKDVDIQTSIIGSKNVIVRDDAGNLVAVCSRAIIHVIEIVADNEGRFCSIWFYSKNPNRKRPTAIL